MTCRHCGTELPAEALFCGECGQPVAAAPAHVATGRSTSAPGAGFSIADLAFSSPGDISQPGVHDRDLPDDRSLDRIDPVGPATHCPQCGEAMATGDVFCGECGFVLRAVSPPSGQNLITLGQYPVDPEAPEPDEEQDDEQDQDDDPDADAPGAGRLDDATTADATTEVEPLSADARATDDAGDDADDEADAPDLDELVVESGRLFVPSFAPPAPASEPAADPDLDLGDPLPFSDEQVTPTAKVSPRSRPIPDPFPWGSDQPMHEDLEATRLVADPAAGARYILQFSTGESVTVGGSGLVGRNPSMQPGEYVDQLVPIFDAGKSVSKTHLEFGQEAGRFWVSDRYSTNGSVIRQPDAEPRRCDPGRRYFVARGTRVDIGEQFFVVS